MLKKQWKLLLCLFLLLINMFIILFRLFTSTNIDGIVSHYATLIATSSLYHVAFSVTKLGSSPFLIPFTLVSATVLIILYRHVKQAIIILGATLSAYGLNELIKLIIKRERPSILATAHATGYSFPSGHAMISLVFYGLLLYYINKKISNKVIKICTSFLFIILIVSLGMSRIILNVHYISDVLSGFLCGFILLQLAVMIDKNCAN